MSDQVDKKGTSTTTQQQQLPPKGPKLSPTSDVQWIQKTDRPGEIRPLDDGSVEIRKG